MKKTSILIETGMFDAFIFDMDGLLFDTEILCWNCFRHVCAEYGYDPDFDIYKRCIGRSAAEGNLLLEECFGKYIPYAEVNRKWNDLYISKIREGNIPLKKGVVRFLKELKKRKIKTAVTTSTVTELALKKLEAGDILNYFGPVTGGDSVKRSKPDPEIYLKTAKILGTDPVRCIAFEDSDNGVRSAHAAGMTVIQIPDLVEPSEDIIKLGHQIIGSFDLIELV